MRCLAKEVIHGADVVCGEDLHFTVGVWSEAQLVRSNSKCDLAFSRGCQRYGPKLCFCAIAVSGPFYEVTLPGQLGDGSAVWALIDLGGSAQLLEDAAIFTRFENQHAISEREGAVLIVGDEQGARAVLTDDAM